MPEKRDLDAELAALEAELAELEKRGKSKPEKPKPAPEAPKERRGFGFGKKKEAPAPAPAAAPSAQAPAPVAAEVVPPPTAPRTDGSLWRQVGHEWVRTVPRAKPVIRRILDEKDQVVREERAEAREVESVGAVQAERGVGRLFRRKRDG